MATPTLTLFDPLRGETMAMRTPAAGRPAFFVVNEARARELARHADVLETMARTARAS